MIAGAERISNVSIYLGTNCNYSCSYCDRVQVSRRGDQKLTLDDVPDILAFLASLRDENGQVNFDYVTFYGGEPLLFLPVIESIMLGTCQNVCEDMRFHIVTNGALVEQNATFFDTWADRLYVSLSYDFDTQYEFREGPTNSPKLDIDRVLDVLDFVQHLEIYYTVPWFRNNALSLQTIQEIVRLNATHNISKVSILPVRQVNTPNGFVTIMDDNLEEQQQKLGMVQQLSLDGMLAKLTRFCQMLYVLGVNVTIDGVDETVIGYPDQFGGHKPVLHILGPDGYIYPEYLYIEYKNTNARIGQWRGNAALFSSEIETAENEVHTRCKTCPESGVCNDKFFYYMEGTEEQLNASRCAYMNQRLGMIVRHIQRLKSKPSLIDHVGIPSNRDGYDYWVEDDGGYKFVSLGVGYETAGL